MDLKDIKEASPIELSEYAVANKIYDETYFSLWVHYVFKKQDRIISKSKNKYWIPTRKYDVRLPKTALEALKLDRQTGQFLWANYLNKEMSKEEVSYDEVEGCSPEQVRRGEVDELKGFQDIICHIVFDVKFYFTCKAEYDANGAMTDTPVVLCHSSVVSL